MADIRPLETEEEFDRAAQRLWETVGAEPGTPEHAEHQILADLVAAYEDIHYPIDDPTPAASIRVQLEDLELPPDALIPIIGSRELAAAVLAGQREVTPAMAQALYERLDIDILDLLPQPAAANS